MCVSFFEFDSCDNYELLLEWAVWKWTWGWVKNTFTLGWTIPLRERRYFMKSLCFAAAEREKVSNRRKGKWGKTVLFIISAYFIGVSLLVAHLTRPTPWLEPVYMIVLFSVEYIILPTEGSLTQYILDLGIESYNAASVYCRVPCRWQRSYTLSILRPCWCCRAWILILRYVLVSM